MGGKNSKNDSSDTLDEDFNLKKIETKTMFKKDFTILEVDKLDPVYKSSSKLSEKLSENDENFNNSNNSKNVKRENDRSTFLKKITDLTKSMQERINTESQFKGYKKTKSEIKYFDESRSSSLNTNSSHDSSHDSSIDFNKDISNIKKDIAKNIYSTESLKIVKKNDFGKFLLIR